MHSLPLYYLARLRDEEIARTARRATLSSEPEEPGLTDVPDRHRRWRVRWDRQLHPAT